MVFTEIVETSSLLFKCLKKANNKKKEGNEIGCSWKIRHGWVLPVRPEILSGTFILIGCDIKRKKKAEKCHKGD